MKILHLIIDHQVVERTLGIYEKLFPNQNSVIVFGQSSQYKHLEKYSEALFVGFGKGIMEGQSYDFCGVTHVIAHYLTMDMIDFIKSVPDNVHVCWEVYGADLYNQFLQPNGMKLYYTDPRKYEKYAFLRSNFPKLFAWMLERKGYKYKTDKHRNQQFRYISDRVNSIQYCCKYDATFIEEYANRHIPSYEIFNYSLKTVLGELADSPFSSGEDVLVGNSASYSNNHFYVLKLLKEKKLSPPSHFILPLSYGGVKAYADDVETAFNSSFPGQIETFRDYIPLHEYNKTFLRLKSMILSAWRQESQGTAIMGFYMGIKVYMSERSPLYKWFKDCGFVVFALEDADQSSFEEPLPSDYQLHNRNLVITRYNEDAFETTLRKHFC